MRAATVALDMAAAAELLSIRRMRGYVGRQSGCGGLPVVRRALDLADETSRSPGEARLRLTWELDCARPRPLTNRDVFDQHGRLLGIADLIDPAAGVAGEYDGAEHARAALNRMPRLWTFEPPPGWPVPSTLDDHLGTQDVLRELYEGVS